MSWHDFPANSTYQPLDGRSMPEEEHL